MYAGSNWTSNTLQSIVLVLASMGLYLLITWFFQFRRAIKLEIKLTNNKTKKSETQLHESSQERDKTIKIGFTLERRMSIFWSLARYMVKRKKVLLKVSSISNDIVLTPKHKKELAEITDDLEGFSIDITDQIFKTLLINVEFPFEKNYEFVVNTRRGIEITPERKILIQTNIFLGENKAGFIFKRLFEVHDGTHTVEIFP